MIEVLYQKAEDTDEAPKIYIEDYDSLYLPYTDEDNYGDLNFGADENFLVALY